MSCNLGIPVTELGDYYFISYNSEDAERVSSIVQIMNKLHIPMWYDKGIDYGDLWEEVIANHIAEAKAVILFFTKGILMKDNSYVSIEYEMAKKYFNVPIYVVFLDQFDANIIPRKMVRWMIELNRHQNLHMNTFSSVVELVDEIKNIIDGKQDNDNISFPMATHTMEIIETTTTHDNTICFGKYPYYPDGTTEKIEWIVLRREENKVLLLSKYGIELKRYHEQRDSISWKDSDLRKWLNLSFIEMAFDENEKARILESIIPGTQNVFYNTANPDNTKDRVFCFGIEDVKDYLPEEELAICIPTPYAKEKGVFTNRGGLWWLRTPGENNKLQTYVNVIGGISYDGCYYQRNEIAMRPAMWITCGDATL